MPNCYLCGHSAASDFFEMPPGPTQDGVMCASRQAAAEVPVGQVRLRYCPACQFVGNEGYEASKISFKTYDFSLDHSPLFQKYMQELSGYLVDKYDLSNKKIIDIGCGDGQFLQWMCKGSGNQGLGIDPGFDHSKRKLDKELDLQFIRDYYSEEFAGQPVDFLACRLVIDLLPDPVAFLKMVRNNLEQQDQTLVFFEVPSASFTFGNQLVWNLVYEHRSWFTPASLRYLFETCGFKVLEIKPLWHNEFLGVIARPMTKEEAAKPPKKEPDELFAQQVRSFADHFSQLTSAHQERISNIRDQQIKTIAWGAGARGMTFLNLFDLSKEVPYIIDINVKRQGKFVPLSGQEIKSPEFMPDYQPDLVIITNPTYAAEIKTHIQGMGLSPDFWVI